jgi:hypothetical protein
MDGETKKLLVAGLVGGLIGIVLTQVTEKLLVPFWCSKCKKEEETKETKTEAPKA